MLGKEEEEPQAMTLVSIGKRSFNLPRSPPGVCHSVSQADSSLCLQLSTYLTAAAAAS